MSDNDLDLLRRFACAQSQDAFTALVQRHVNLIYSAALRQVRSPQLAEEIAQSVFADLARDAGKISGTGVSPVTSLTPWLYAVTRRTAIDVIRKESRRQLREQIAVEMNNMNATANEWTQIEPLLDEAMAALDETDRSAILLRYFENKTLREVGAALGTNDDAAQKRVSRAVERLREFFSKQKITIGAGGLAVLISANAVQAAPIGLAATISAAAVLAGTAIQTSTLIAATKTIAMTTLQKTLVTAALAAAVGTGIFEAHQAAQLRDQNQTIQQQQTSLAEQIQQTQHEHDDATNRLVTLIAENERLKSNSNAIELLRLRGEVGRLQREMQDLRIATASARQTAATTALPSSTNQVTAKLFVSGEVTVPGPKVWTQGMKLMDAIRMGENMTDWSLKKAIVKSSSGTTNVYDLADIINRRVEDPLLQPNDSVVIPRMEDVEAFKLNADYEIHVSGAVVLPSHWTWTDGMKLTDGIKMVGGLTDFANGRVQITHRYESTNLVVNFSDIQNGRAVDIALKPGDGIEALPPRAPKRLEPR